MGKPIARLCADRATIAAPPREAFGPHVEREVEAATHAWQFALLVEIANFRSLRRFVGPLRADGVASDVAGLIHMMFPGGSVRVAGRGLIELLLCDDARERLDDMLREVRGAFANPIDIDGEMFTIELWIGSAAVQAVNHDEIRLLEEAEEALGDARVAGGVIAREVAVNSHTPEQVALVREMREAIVGGQLFLQYQPKIHVRRQEVSGVEALIRWRHPDRGLVMPGDFIPLAEESEHILDLTIWTLRQVISDQLTLAQAGHDVPVFINIAGVLLANPRFVHLACSLVEESGAKIGFEITETSVIRDPASAIANLKTFAEIGITIAIDDYGAGLSSLAYLKQLPARELKIDKLFVTQLTSSNRDPLIVRSTIDLAHALEMEVVAEGVETQAALALLAVMGCDMAQGVLISRPIGLEALIKYLEHGRANASSVISALNGRFTPSWRR